MLSPAAWSQRLLQLVAQVDRQARGFGDSLAVLYLEMVIYSFAFGLLFRNSGDGYVYASAVFALESCVPSACILLVVAKYASDYAVFRKEHDMGAVSPLLFCFSSAIIYTVFFALPVLFAEAITYAFCLWQQVTFKRLAVVCLICTSGCVSGVLLSLALGAMVSRYRLPLAAHTTLGVGFWAGCGILSSFYISYDDTASYLRWSYYVSPSFYTFTSAIRVLLQGLPVTCSSNLLASVAACVELSPEGYLAQRGYDKVDVGLHMGLQLCVWAVLLLLFWFWLSEVQLPTVVSCVIGSRVKRDMSAAAVTYVSPAKTSPPAEHSAKNPFDCEWTPEAHRGRRNTLRAIDPRAQRSTEMQPAALPMQEPVDVTHILNARKHSRVHSIRSVLARHASVAQPAPQALLASAGLSSITSTSSLASFSHAQPAILLDDEEDVAELCQSFV